MAAGAEAVPVLRIPEPPVLDSGPLTGSYIFTGFHPVGYLFHTIRNVLPDAGWLNAP